MSRTSRIATWLVDRPGAAFVVVLVVAAAVVGPATVVVPLVGRLTATDVTDGTGVSAPAPATIVQPVGAKAVTSAVTVTGKGEFAALKVTVGQTRDLINQTVQLTWSGGKPTNDAAAFDVDYLQVMQCWGDAATGPERTQCEFGGNAAFDNRGGQNTASRQLTTATYKDAKDPLLTKAAAGTDVFVPFVSVTDVTVKGQDTLKNPFYDNTTTNELTYARTRGDGNGAALFEMLTYREAPGLGCGALLTSGTSKGQPRACWLVVVPRGETEVDGSNRSAVIGSSTHRLDTSPLSTTNWANRLVVPLGFVAVGNACPIAAAQKQTTGVESATEVVLRWQPALCRNNGPVFGYSQSPDATADRTLATDAPGMVFLNGPASAPPADRLYTYAPIALSGLVIGVTIDRQSPAAATATERASDGAPMTDVNLTPRLVAKLLTQSYRFEAPGNGTATYLEKNVDNITKDPDFLAVNPAFKTTAFSSGVTMITPIGLSSSTQLLWQWIGDDQEASDFLAGLPDPWGMRVNPFYQGASSARNDYPKIDPYCATVQTGAPPLCTLDEHPYSQDLHEAARSAARGDSLSRNFWDANAKPEPVWKKRQLQLVGRRQLLAVTDSATAARYGLVTAKLRNASGAFVAPTTTSLLAAAKSLRATSVAGVSVPDPSTSNAAAYPLPLITYAATAPNILTAADAKSYGAFVRYAAGSGQAPGSAAGTLPFGYAPLPATMRTAALAAAKAIEARKGPKVTTAGTSTGTGSKTGTKTGTGTTTSRAGTGTGTGTGSNGTTTGANGTTPLVTPSASTGAVTGTGSVPADGLPQSASPSAITNAASAGLTPAEPAGNGEYALVIALVLGVASALFGPSLPRLARRLRQ